MSEERTHEATDNVAQGAAQEPVWTPKKGKVQRVRTPLPSAGAVKGVNAAFIRAENEDDDGYDPYSDRVEVVPFFESDPWS